MVRLLFVEDDVRLHELVPRLTEGTSLLWQCAGTAARAMDIFEHQDVDLALVDLGLPDLDGITLIERMVARKPGVPVVVLTVTSTEARVVAAMNAGASGYVLKEDMGSRLPAALLDVLQGGVPMSPAAARAVLAQLRRSSATAQSTAESLLVPGEEIRPLTARETEVVEQLGRGLSYHQVSLVLGISINTVRVHVRSAYEKLGAASKTEAVVIALARGLAGRRSSP